MPERLFMVVSRCLPHCRALALALVELHAAGGADATAAPMTAAVRYRLQIYRHCRTLPLTAASMKLRDERCKAQEALAGIELTFDSAADIFQRYPQVGARTTRS